MGEDGGTVVIFYENVAVWLYLVLPIGEALFHDTFFREIETTVIANRPFF